MCSYGVGNVGIYNSAFIRTKINVTYQAYDNPARFFDHTELIDQVNSQTYVLTRLLILVQLIFQNLYFLFFFLIRHFQQLNFCWFLLHQLFRSQFQMLLQMVVIIIQLVVEHSWFLILLCMGMFFGCSAFLM